jgi:2'-5' RNA ligase
MRIFYGVPIKYNDTISYITKKLKKAVHGNYVKKENLHITLKFVGEINEQHLDTYINKLKNINFEEFELEFNYVSAFPSKYNPRVIWIGCNGDFGRFQEIIEDENFIPHLTLVRVKKIIDWNELKKIFDLKFSFKIKISEVVLYQSILTPQGPIYKKIFSISSR